MSPEILDTMTTKGYGPMTSTKVIPIGDFWMELHDLKLLRALVKSHGITHRDLATAAGYKTHTYVGKLLRGQAKTLEPTPAARIAHYFGVDLNDLFLPRSSMNSVQDDQRSRRRVA